MTAPVSPRWAAPVLVGDRVTLRQVGAADAAAMWEMVNDAEGNDLTATTTSFDRQQVADWYASRGAQDGRLDLAVVENATGEVVGEAVLNDHEESRDSANFRIALRGPAWYGRGLGGEATRLLVDHGLRTMGLAEITLGVLARNPRARRAYEAAGFTVTGERHEDGEDWVDMAVRRSWLAPDYPVTTERLLLRPIEPARDAVAIHGYRSREDVCRYVPFSPGPLAELEGRLADPERVRSAIDAEGQALQLVVEHRATGQVIGDVVLMWHSASDGRAEVGYVLHPDHGGHGYATEAVRAVLGLAFDGLRAHRVTALIDARNAASAALVERLGMRREATHVDGGWFKGEWTTTWVYALLDREWRTRQEAAVR